MLLALSPFFDECTHDTKSFVDNYKIGKPKRSFDYGKKPLATMAIMGLVALAFTLQIILQLWAILLFRPVNFTIGNPEAEVVTTEEAKKARVKRAFAWMLYFSVPYLIVALDIFASTARYFYLLGVIWKNLTALRAKLAKFRKKELEKPRMELSNPHTEPKPPNKLRMFDGWSSLNWWSWCYVFLGLAGLVNFATFLFTMVLLYLMLTSDDKPVDRVIPSILNILKDIIALEYIIHVDTKLFGIAKSLLNVKPPDVIFVNIFEQDGLKKEEEQDGKEVEGERGDLNCRSRLKSEHCWKVFKKVILVGGTICIPVLSLLLAYSRWDSQCFNTSFFESARNLSEDDEELYGLKIVAQECAAVLDNFKTPNFLKFCSFDSCPND